MDNDKVFEEAVVLAGVMATDVVVDDAVEVDDPVDARVTDEVSVVDVEDVAVTTSLVAAASSLFSLVDIFLMLHFVLQMHNYKTVISMSLLFRVIPSSFLLLPSSSVFTTH